MFAFTVVFNHYTVVVYSIAMNFLSHLSCQSSKHFSNSRVREDKTFRNGITSPPTQEQSEKWSSFCIYSSAQSYNFDSFPFSPQLHNHDGGLPESFFRSPYAFSKHWQTSVPFTSTPTPQVPQSGSGSLFSSTSQKSPAKSGKQVHHLLASSVDDDNFFF
ncbi:hypothetical protein T10_2044 [Trichinella papuae]|uniref:Uncharacterized protein n=1 Tax=Trichinella papuae TaxID=268474 RepID=A0A0V1MXI3_9BILA|nr:hypothetical protein T10_2044 [Trichinella papuae]